MPRIALDKAKPSRHNSKRARGLRTDSTETGITRNLQSLTRLRSKRIPARRCHRERKGVKLPDSPAPANCPKENQIITENPFALFQAEETPSSSDSTHLLSGAWASGPPTLVESQRETPTSPLSRIEPLADWASCLSDDDT